MKASAFVSILLVAGFGELTDAEEPLTPPPQGEGRPYTRTAMAVALDRIRGGIAVFPGSRYAYVHGVRVRINGRDVLRGEAFEDKGVLWVPETFGPLIAKPVAAVSPVPSDLAAIADRWVYAPSDFKTRDVRVPPGIASRTIGDGTYVDLHEIAKVAGLPVKRYVSGLCFVGENAPEIPEGPAMDAVISMFDTPEKFADPDIARRNIPILTRQGPWTEHVRATPEQLALLRGPVTDWQGVPAKDYDSDGINETLFGSKVPEPGIYPRLLFSEADLPGIARRVRSTVIGQIALIEMEHLFRKTWWDPSKSDGMVFEKLASGSLKGLEWDMPAGRLLNEVPHIFKGQQPGIYNSHVAYVPECLTSMALYCLLTGDDALGKKVATAVANYYRLREPLLDEWLQISDSEFGSSLKQPDGTLMALNGCGARTHWRNTHGLMGHMNLGLSLDFAGKWMTTEQKDAMRRIIAKSTYGRRSHGQDGPVRFRDVNWMTWDLTHFLAVAAIEGLEGCDPEAYASGRESIRAFCDWGIDRDGVIFESNGKSGGGLQFQLLSMVVAARRGENLFAHPHWRALLEGQVQMTSPTGRVIPNSGTVFVPYSRAGISLSFARQLKSFYPGSRLPDYLITAARSAPGAEMDADTPGFDAEAYRRAVAGKERLRLPGITYPGLSRAVLYDADVVPTTREDLGLPLDFDAPVHGVFSAYSDRSPDAAWMNVMVRPNHYLGAGHHHADAGMFHFSALGVDWITESPFTQSYSGNFHNLVLVDGLSEAEGIAGIVNNVVNGYNAAGKYLGARVGEVASSASADLTYAYSWRWNTQPPQVWSGAISGMDWEMDPSPELAKIFAGTERYKLRPWWPNYNCSNFIPTSRAPYNPMEYVFRTAGLVRGKHPYGFVLDDLKKDSSTRLYQWTVMLNGGVGRADVQGLPPNAVALASSGREADSLSGAEKPPLVPKAGDPLLLVYALGMEESGDPGIRLISVETLEGPNSKNGQPQFCDRLIVSHRAENVRFRILLLPVRAGRDFPRVTYDARNGKAEISWPDQRDEIAFRVEGDFRTVWDLRRIAPATDSGE